MAVLQGTWSWRTGISTWGPFGHSAPKCTPPFQQETLNWPLQAGGTCGLGAVPSSLPKTGWGFPLHTGPDHLSVCATRSSLQLSLMSHAHQLMKIVSLPSPPGPIHACHLGCLHLVLSTQRRFLRLQLPSKDFKSQPTEPSSGRGLL